MSYNKCSFLLYTPLSQKWSVIEQFGYHIWIQQRQVSKDHPSFFRGRKLMPTSDFGGHRFKQDRHAGTVVTR
jgi:hypothetical protein